MQNIPKDLIRYTALLWLFTLRFCGSGIGREPVMKSIGARIRTSRKNKKLTQEQLAEVLSVSPQTVGKWEDRHIRKRLTNIYEIFPVDFFLNTCYICSTYQKSSIKLFHYNHFIPMQAHPSDVSCYYFPKL